MMTDKNETAQPAPLGQVERGVRPTHWMDDRGLYVSDEWLQSDQATSDYRAAYVVPAKMTRAGIRPLYPCRTCSVWSTGEDSREGDACHDCGGSGGLTKQAIVKISGARSASDAAPS
ncbi:MAG: hypothetical protein ACK5QX_09625 [bacterium]